jgi:hypothetical protein
MVQITMAPRKATDAEGQPTGLTAAENKFIKTMFDNMKTRPDADWDKVAEQMTLKDAKCAKERFRQIAQRHGWNNSGPGKVTKKPATGAARKKAAAAKQRDDEEDDEEMADSEVKKLVKKRAGGKKAVKKEESGTEDDSLKGEDEV